MPAGYTVGSAHVQVLPSLRGFQRDVGRQLRGVKADVTSKIRPELDKTDADRAARDIEALSQRVAKARSAEVDAAGKVRIAEAKLAEARDSGTAKASQLVVAEERLTKATRDHASAQAVTVRLTEQETQARVRLAEATARTDRNNRGLLSSLRGISAGFRDVDDKPLRNAVGTLAKVGAYSTVAAGGIAAMGSSLPALISLAGALAQTAGAAALLPAALVAGGLAIGALKLGTAGLGDALKNLGDPTKFAESLKGLAPSARGFATAIRDLKPAFDQVRLDTQQALFRGLGEQVTALGKRYMPALRSSLAAVAAGFNTAAQDTGKFLAAPSVSADITAGLINVTGAIRSASGALRPLVMAFTDLFAVGSEFLPNFGTGIAGLAESFRRFIDSARESGQLREWIQGALDRLRQLWDVVSNLGSIFWSVFSAASAAGSDLLTTIQGLTGELAGALRSPEGQSALQGFFTNLRGLVDSVKPGLRAIGSAVASVVRSIAPSLPAIGAAFSAIAIQVAPLLADLGKLAGAVLPKLAAGLAFIAPLAPYLLMAAGAIMGVVKAIKVWAVVQLILNQVMNANPVFRIVGLLFLLVGALVYAYNHSETFRAIVQRVWSDIQNVVAFAWNNVIKPVFDALAWFMRNVIAPAATWLWEHALKPAFDGIGAAIDWTWNSIVKPIFDMWVWYFKDVIAPVAMWLWDTMIKPAFDGIGAVVSWAWNNVLKPIFDALTWYLTTIVGPTVLWLWHNIVQPAFDGIGATITWVWANVIRPAFDAIKSAVDSVASAFQSAVDNIGVAWSRIQELALKPVNFIIGTVYNDGIRAAFNKIAETLGAPFRLPALPLIGQASGSAGGGRPMQMMATGGPVPGTGIGDKVMILADPREYVLNPKMVDLFGVDNLEAIRRQTLRGKTVGLEGLLAGFAEGGPIERATAFARAQSGKPYQWGGVGNPSFDCSGLMSAIQNVLLGRPPNRRLYTTSQFGAGRAPAGLKPGLGSAFTVGVQPGHMAGTLNGVAVESGGSGGVMFGGRARGTKSFPWQFYLPAAGGQFVDDGGGGGEDLGFLVGQLSKVIDGVFARLTPQVGGGEFGALMARIPRKTADAALQRLAALVDNRLPFDQGGYLPPGWSTVYNGTGRPEAVFTQQQLAALRQGGTPLDGARITGTLDLGNGLTGFVDGRIETANQAAGTAINQRRRV